MLIVDESIARILFVIPRFLFLFVIYFWIYRAIRSFVRKNLTRNILQMVRWISEILRVSEDFLFGVKII